MYIGKRMKDIREQKGIKLIELAAKSGVQLATLSRIEHLKMTGTLESHMKIAKALEVDLTDLYKEILTDAHLAEMKTPKSLTDMFVHTDKASFEMLTNRVLSKKMMPILIKLEGGGKTNKEKSPIGGEKFVYVLDGKIEVKVGTQKFPLSKSNTLYFDSSVEHYFENVGKAPAKVICVGTPVML